MTETGSALLAAIGDAESKLVEVSHDVTAIRSTADKWPSAVENFQAAGDATLDAAKRLRVGAGALERLTPELARVAGRFEAVVERFENAATRTRPISSFGRSLWDFLNRDISLFRGDRR